MREESPMAAANGNLPTYDAIAADVQQRQRIRKEIQSQLAFASEWGTLMEKNRPATTIEEEIARKKAELAA